MKNKKVMTQEELQKWTREQYMKATKYLAEKGLVTESVADTESRYLVPTMAVWKINLLDKTKVWVITGDLPTDHLALAENEPARDVLRHFSFKWQVQADGLLASDNQEQVNYGKFLIGRAEGLYELYSKDELWV
ncbi:DUF4826 family protein [Cognaticolwellia mytili]|uniref:DUF4826 family protein n=1 Tax=Cognaticolwellia mytili TaxID=1888913 RepID=UPI001F19EB72|nr:DUF4826 family protein [Cognaticolwellia mytili]